jgi:hypothetical protein
VGWDSVRIVIDGHVSRHNSDQDQEDDWLMDELADRLRLIVAEHRYDSLGLMVHWR